MDTHVLENSTPIFPLSSGRVTGIACLWIPVKDIRVSTRWYADTLGLKVLQEPTEHRHSLLQLAPEGPGLFLKQTDEATPLHFESDGHRTAIFEFRVDDIEAFHHRMRANHIPVFDRHDAPPCGKYLYLVDPDGNKIQIWGEA
jgi:catechol 2,3-dioxygenase-like lactoylglutathione lyase family enzyme